MFLFKSCASVSIFCYIQTNKLFACKIKVVELIKDKYDKIIKLKRIMNCWFLILGAYYIFSHFEKT